MFYIKSQVCQFHASGIYKNTCIAFHLDLSVDSSKEASVKDDNVHEGGGSSSMT